MIEKGKIWKFSGVILIVYVIIAGLLIPLKSNNIEESISLQNNIEESIPLHLFTFQTQIIYKSIL